MSRAPKAVRARRRRAAQATLLSVVVATLVVLAVRHDGAPVHDVDLNDGGVWVTNEQLALTGRFNDQIDEIDMVVPTSATSDDIFQQASSVQVFDDRAGGDGGTFFVVDVVTGEAKPIDLPGDQQAVASRDTVGILDREDGQFWVRRPDQLDGFADGLTPTGEVSKHSQIVATVDGTVLVADRSKGTVEAWSLDDTGTAVAGDTFDFDREFVDDAQLSAVGDEPVVLQSGSVLRADEDPVSVEGDSPQLQQPSAESDYVRIATTTGLWQVQMHGGDKDEVSGLDVEGSPAAPLVYDGCVYGAWADPADDNVLLTCDDGTTMSDRAVLAQTNDLVFRRNRDVVVLNNAANGVVDVVELTGLSRMADWDSYDPNKPDPQESKDDDVITTTKRNQPPTAVDDDFGGRAGATVLLPVTLNDEDPDGDLLVISELPATSDGIDELTVVGDGTQVQAKLNGNAKGTVEFTYSITDGHTGHKADEATVSVKVYPTDVDKPPALDEDRAPTMEVVNGAESTINVLPAWLDPEGDSVVLVSATARDDTGDVAFRPDGTVTFSDDGQSAGQEVIEYAVRGGTDQAVTEGTVPVNVVEPAKASPTAVPDRYAGTVGSTIVMDPLTNDLDPFGETLTLGRISDLQGGSAQVAVDTTTGLATFVAQAPRTYFATYTATARNGVTSPPTTIRIDVTAPAQNNRAPVAVRDIAVMRPGSSTLVDVLANDYDPDDDVLVVQGVEIPDRWRGHIKASLVNKQFIRVEADDTVRGERPELEYLLSDGASDQVTGSIVLAEGEEVTNHLPLAVEDVYTVRAGTVVTLPVRDNDRDPDGDLLTVSQSDLYNLGGENVITDHRVPIVATGAGIRVLVPDDGSTDLQFGYGVRDAADARSDSRVVLNILPDDPEGNQDPKPQPLEGRTVTGQVIRIPVDTFGADPDGDPVVFYGVDDPPKLGRIVGSGAQWFDYEPFSGVANTGTDVFTVRVKDQYGATAKAQVRIGVAARTKFNQAPASLDDSITVKPGRKIQYPVLDNDSDPDGDQLILLPEKLYGGEGTDAEVLDGGLIQVTSPELKGRPKAATVLAYSVTDGLGVESSARLTVNSSAEAPEHPPIATDDIADATDVNGKVAGDTVDVDVLANDGDLDGSREDLELAPLAGRSETIVDDKLRVTLAPDGQIVPYQITDLTDQTSYGFVYVTGTEDLAPTLNTAVVPLEVVGGEDLDIDLADVVIVRSGHTPKIVKRNDIYSSIGDVKSTGPSQMLFHAAKDYAGPAAITLDVHDGEELNSPDTLISQITIPITVLPAQNVPPTLRSANVDVLGGGEPVTLMLDRMAADANKDDSLDFAVTGDGDGLKAEISDGLLVISADSDAFSADVPLTLSVTDGHSDPVEGTVDVTLHGRTPGSDGGEGEEEVAPQPPMTLQDLSVTDAVVGKAEKFNIADAVLFDPYPGEAKTVSSISVNGAATATGEGGSTITVTPSGDGEITVSYVAEDGSGDPERTASGKIHLTVAGLPDAPGKPTAVESGPESIQLAWKAPDDHGSDIDHYVVRWNNGSESTECRQQQCPINGLSPGETYVFTVAAVNGITVDGKSEGPESPPSDPVTPDKVPDKMSKPVVTSSFEDRNQKLALQWTEPNNDGSDILRYEFQISKGSSGAVDRSVDYPAKTLVWEPLLNGEEYSFRVRAVNKEGPTGNTGWSEYSAPETPFTVPSQVPTPSVQTENGVAGSGGYVTATWQASGIDSDGGDEVSGYEVRLLRDGAELTVVPVSKGETTRVFDDVENGHTYSVQVRAQNRAGWSEWSTASEGKLSWDPATAPTGLSNGGDCPNNACASSTTAYNGKLDFTTPSDNGGFEVTRYSYSTADGSSGTFNAPTTGQGAAASVVIPFRSSNGNQWVEIQPITDVQGQATPGSSARSGGIFNPYALPGTPSQGSPGAGYKSVSFNWNSGAANGRAVDQTQYQVQSSGGAVNAGAGGGSKSVDTAQGGDQACLRVRSHNAAGWSAWGGYSCGNAQPRTLAVTFTQTTDIPASSCYRPCYHIGWSIAGFKSGASYSADWKSEGSSSPVCNSGYQLPRSLTVGSDGRAARTENWYISYSCKPAVVTVRIDGVTGSRGVP